MARKPLLLPLFANQIPAHWEWSRLDELSEVFDCPHSTPLLTETGPFVARSQDIRSGVFLREGAARVSEDIYKERTSRSEPTFGDLLYSREGTYFGIAAAVPNNVRLCLGQRMVLIRPNRQMDSQFLRYWLNSPQVSQHIHGYRDGTVAERLNLPTIRALPVAFPDLVTQQKIGNTLLALDDKIALLRETNSTLEAIAQALFKSWFVNFDPVRAKAEGRDPEGVPPEVADLFPSEFEDSELGAIPKGWSIGTLAQAALLFKQSRKPQDEPETKFDHYSLPAFDNGQCPVCEAGSAIKSHKFAVPVDAVLISKLNPHIPRIWLPAVSDPQVAVCSTEFLVMKPKAVFSREWIYLLACSEQFKSWLLQLVTGTSNSHQRVKPDNLTDIHIVHPPALVMNAFTAITSPMLGRVMKNRVEIQTLASTRDTLLPRLMSGKLRVGEPQMEVR